MKFLIGKSYRQILDNNMYLDISVFPEKWATTINMSLWKEGNGVALASLERKYLNIDKFMPLKLAENLGAKLINKQSQKVAGFDLILQ